ncbi:MAG: colicin uptake protein, partial [Fuerstiella sp.]|nr:colicin uptake protein [Fuerstiella sp.]
MIMAIHCLVAVLILSAEFCTGQDDHYVQKIRPLINERCLACHGALKQEAGLRLDTGQLIRKGGDNGPVVDTVNVSDSLLLMRLTSDDRDIRMPPDGMSLTEEQVNQFRHWIR